MPARKGIGQRMHRINQLITKIEQDSINPPKPGTRKKPPKPIVKQRKVTQTTLRNETDAFLRQMRDKLHPEIKEQILDAVSTRKFNSFMWWEKNIELMPLKVERLARSQYIIKFGLRQIGQTQGFGRGPIIKIAMNGVTNFTIIRIDR